ncbi:glutathione peroxidase [Oleiagrimonas sp. C23AA]|uniref:glutathione peroxidase n=1 Tax=Oleiagrimonas sp. C23AA TaxID=2719047 RepID=UPI001422C380|nr:glutathione peroxidase [Oleiagrimonas sp. C23AA]NII10474.1 glutathione peroxidase [Oleiagrimonas sp. C23AA]
MGSIYDFHARDIAGHDRSLAEWREQVLLVVNVASQCGFTPQYEGLQSLQDDLGAQGFSVLGFPCDQFGHQEPGDEAAIEAFCSTRFGVSFPMFSKIAVNGHRADPLFRWLKGQARGVLGSRAIKWNFTKFLVDREGQVLRRYAPTAKPAQLRADIEALLA